MITIKKAASLTGLSVKAIRHYESRGLLPKPERTDAGYRMYSESDIARLQQIRYFREMKFPLTGNRRAARRIHRRSAESHDPPAGGGGPRTGRV